MGSEYVQIRDAVEKIAAELLGQKMEETEEKKGLAAAFAKMFKRRKN